MVVATIHALVVCVFALGMLQYCSSFTIPSPKILKVSSNKKTLLSHHDIKHESVSIDESIRRRIILAAPTLLLPSNIVNAAETPAESIRLLSSKTIPGLGPPDVYYPPFFAGKWKVTKVITKSDDNLWSDLEQDLPITIVSEMRFVPYDAGKDFSNIDYDGNPNNVPAIADRSFNEQSYYTAMIKERSRLYQQMKQLPSIQTINWTPTNPNVLSMSYQDGSSKEVKVTKRSSDVSKEGDTVFSSEFRRITDVDQSSAGSPGGVGGIPRIYKSRVLTKWKQGSDGMSGGMNRIEGIEIAYNEVGTLGEKNAGVDPLLGGRFGEDTKDLSDWRSTKTKILMERID